jgi:hypothetical protein
MTVAALYVDPQGIYSTFPDVELWDEARDARTYAGPHPVVAHPPCSRWCRLAGLVEARWGHKRGEDGGAFEAALASVRQWGGVLEHPAYSDAWLTFDLPPPPTEGWQRGICGGWSCHVEQSRYGHVAKKATWLYAYGADAPPSLRWGSTHDRELGLVSWCGNRVKTTHADGRKRQQVGKARAAATPPEFAAVLLGIARSVATEEETA